MEWNPRLWNAAQKGVICPPCDMYRLANAGIQSQTSKSNFQMINLMSLLLSKLFKELIIQNLIIQRRAC